MNSVILGMPGETLANIVNTDIYLIDQIIKGRYKSGGRLLDAGCGGGRNISWFVTQPGFEIYATDISQPAIDHLSQLYPGIKREHAICAPIQSLPFDNSFFDHVICSAVLHFAGSAQDFLQMFSELCRVLKTGGSLFIRMASDIGIENNIVDIGDGRFALPDGTDRFLLTRALIEQLLANFPVVLVEPVKTTNVQDIRCMTTLMIRKSTS